LTIALIASATIIMASASEEESSITPELALQKLMEGNLRYAEGNASHPINPRSGGLSLYPASSPLQ